jgi:hypothetical protein
LWPDSDSRSTFQAGHVDRHLADPCAASVWNSAPACLGDRREGGNVLHDADLVVHRHDADQQRGHGKRLAQRLGVQQPVGPHRQEHRLEAFRPSGRHRFQTHLCSVATVMMRRRSLPDRSACRAAPLMAMLLLSVAPEVNTTSRGSAPISAATCARASSAAVSAAVPITCSTLCGLPYCSLNQGSMTASTRGSQRVVAWLSR